MIKKLLRNIFGSEKSNKTVNPIDEYMSNGRIPWSEGYQEYKFKTLFQHLRDDDLSRSFDSLKLPNDYGHGLDERIVEIPWAVNKLSSGNAKLLDAGSSLNFKAIVTLEKIENKDVTIYTFDPERKNFNNKRVSYVYSDLRDLPFKDNLYDEIACISTIEHIDMDNSIYGWNENNAHVDNQNKSYEYLKVVEELVRVLKSDGKLLLTFPYGKFENHGFFQQFDREMLDRVLELFDKQGTYGLTFFRYLDGGWNFCEQEDCADIISFNPHTGRGKLDDGAAH